MKIWLLKMFDAHGTSWCVYGDETVLRTAYDEWKSAVESHSTEGILEVIGFCDDAKRTRFEARILVDTIVGMFLTEL